LNQWWSKNVEGSSVKPTGCIRAGLNELPGFGKVVAGVDEEEGTEGRGEVSWQEGWIRVWMMMLMMMTDELDGCGPTFDR
jgi:hypothetical protein